MVFRIDEKKTRLLCLETRQYPKITIDCGHIYLDLHFLIFGHLQG